MVTRASSANGSGDMEVITGTILLRDLELNE
jgi:hypothetical protein